MLTALLCTDGSDLARAALAEGLEVIGKPDRVALVTVVGSSSSVTAFGSDPGRMSSSPASDEEAEATAAGRMLEETARALGLDDAERHVLGGAAGEAICALAESLPASVLVLGTRGHGGLRRAVLGSVSQHVVRNATCPVVITGPAAE